jgi:polar amino acid transport system substrate-binding protein
MDLLVQRFGAELKRFKREAGLRRQRRYGGIDANTPPATKTVEQQESSAQ